jgi:chromosome segregation ATPase
MTEVDRSRQSAKERERQIKELQGLAAQLHTERNRLKQELTEVRSDLKTAAAVRQQLEARLRPPARRSPPVMRKPNSKSTGASKRTQR